MKEIKTFIERTNMSTFTQESGKPYPLGVTFTEQGVNFSLFAEHAQRVTLCLLHSETEKIVARIPLDPEKNKTEFFWHIELKGLELPLLYGYRIDGSHHSPFFYDPKILLVDPYAKILKTPSTWGVEKKSYHPYGVVMPLPEFNWEKVTSPQRKIKELIIYEMHVRGFTKDHSSQVKYPGTFLGMIEKIPYLLDLGANAIEIMPCQEFDECSTPFINPLTQEKLYNYWGYSSLNFFSPMMRYASGEAFCQNIQEFKTMIKEMHRHGIEVILDLVLNHTGEKRGEEKLTSFVGIDRPSYYLLSKGFDTNYTGCGNTMNVNHPMMHHFLIDCLHYFVKEMHIDGFRFDLASIFNRNQEGHLMAISGFVEDLTYDPVLSKVKFIAEPWDAAGGYQLGGFFPSHTRWSEWNGQYRDAIRKFIKGDPHSKNEFASKVCGSEMTFPQRNPQASINFVTAHDGFTLVDLVSYEKKHNLANGENNKDGSDMNFSYNCGVEGETKDPLIEKLREKQRKNFLVALMMSQGVPMLLMGDEYGHTKKGNNNTWCQDNELNYFLWDKVKENFAFYRFVRGLIKLRKEHPALKRERFFKQGEVIWHGLKPCEPHWEKPAPLLAFTIIDPEKQEDLYLAFNASKETVSFKLPLPKEGRKWYRLIDTSKDGFQDMLEKGEEERIHGLVYVLDSFSSLVLISYADK